MRLSHLGKKYTSMSEQGKKNISQAKKGRTIPFNKVISNQQLARKLRNYANKNLKKDNKCFFCNSNQNLEFHHLNYDENKPNNNVITLCKDCHTKIHIIQPKILNSQAKEIFEKILEGKVERERIGNKTVVTISYIENLKKEFEK